MDKQPFIQYIILCLRNCNDDHIAASDIRMARTELCRMVGVEEHELNDFLCVFFDVKVTVEFV